jgi:hypothetical protein
MSKYKDELKRKFTLIGDHYNTILDLKSLLRKLEWRGDNGTCPCCGADEFGLSRKHADDCELAGVLK